MNYEQTGLPDTPLLRLAYGVSIDMNPVSNRDCHYTVIKPARYALEYGQDVTEMDVACLMLENAASKNVETFAQLPEELSGKLIEYCAQMLMFRSAFVKLQRTNIPYETAEALAYETVMSLAELETIRASTLAKIDTIGSFFDVTDAEMRDAGEQALKTTLESYLAAAPIFDRFPPTLLDDFIGIRGRQTRELFDSARNGIDLSQLLLVGDDDSAPDAMAPGL